MVNMMMTMMMTMMMMMMTMMMLMMLTMMMMMQIGNKPCDRVQLEESNNLQFLRHLSADGDDHFLLVCNSQYTIPRMQFLECNSQNAIP